MPISVYNTLTRRKEELRSSRESIGIYVCGVTPYSDTHLGHARPSVVWDVIKKYLHYRGYKTYHVQNFTDIDDKIINRALELGVEPLKLAEQYSEEYLESMDALGVARADLYPRVSRHIPDIISMIERLIERGHAYAVNGNVFYSVLSFPEYGKLSNQKIEQLQAGTRFEVDPDKKHPLDFALWKKAKPNEPAWDSPWGKGRPGWHIECSVMSHKYLGEEFDFHGGGADLIFPHHENEIAQSEGATGRPLAKYWLHNGMINLKQEKMSKSLGNIVKVKDLLEKYPKELIRFFILSSHYRSELEYHDQKLEEVSRGWQRLNECVNKLAGLVDGKEFTPEPLDEAGAALVKAAEEAEARFAAAMDDDFNTALALGILFDFMRQVNAYMAGLRSEAGDYALYQAYQLFAKLAGGIFGIVRLEEQRLSGLSEPLLDLLLELRTELRSQKQYQLADYIRSRLAELNVAIEDTPQGPRWKMRS